MTAYTRRQVFEPGAFLRACDVCGIRFRSTELVRGEDGFWRCTFSCVEVPPITRDKIIAQSQRRKEAPPPPHGIPYDIKDTYEAESRIFNFVCESPVPDSSVAGGVRLGAPPFDTIQVNLGAGNRPVSSLGTAVSAGETIRYLYNIIVENRRPSRWITVAKAKMRELADWIIANQIGFGVTTSATQANNWAWGSFWQSGQFVITISNAMAGVGLVYAYRILGDLKYLTSAQAMASCVRNCQARGTANAINFVSSDSGGTVPLYTGGLEDRFSIPGGSLLGSHKFFLSGVSVLEFLSELYKTSGDGLYGAPGAIANAFSGGVQVALSQMIADLRAFWSVGAFDQSTGTTYTGLSASSPREFFNAYNSANATFGNGTGSWEFQDGGAATGTLVTSSGYSHALRALYGYEGYSAQVSSVWTWLMGFATNPAYVMAAGSLASDYATQTSTFAANPPSPPSGQGNSVAPGYNPKLALSTLLLVRDSTNNYAAIAQNGSSLYDWSTTGDMAPIQAAQDGGSLRKAKDTLTATYYRLRPENITDGSYVTADWLLLRGQSGLAFQMQQADQGARIQWSSSVASAIGNVFRYQPQSWTGYSNQQQTAPGLQV